LLSASVLSSKFSKLLTFPFRKRTPERIKNTKKTFKIEKRLENLKNNPSKENAKSIFVNELFFSFTRKEIILEGFVIKDELK